jgi:hypothetical protein
VTVDRAQLVIDSVPAGLADDPGRGAHVPGREQDVAVDADEHAARGDPRDGLFLTAPPAPDVV